MEGRMPVDIQVLGSINVDHLLSVERLPQPGDTVLAQTIHRLPGGKGANQAVAAARMGAQVAMTGATGMDGEGTWMRQILSDEGVDIDGIGTIKTAPTGAAFIAVDAKGENQIIVSPGANAMLTSSKTVDASVVLAQLEIPMAVIEDRFAGAAALRLLNAAPFVPDAVRLFPHADIVIVNEHELAGYAGHGTITERTAIVDSARSLLSRTEQTIIVTLGALGAIAVTNKSYHPVAPLPVIPRDTVGAGDCFCGALAAQLAAGASLDNALTLANTAAAMCTLGVGAIPAMPHRAAVEAVLAGAATRPDQQNMR
ncbi:ribokinase [Sphingomonas sp. FW199]|uniref:ribokinase n=1 Tax=Sphingomonas sp. FW199 TaxID=3400217 RepID=UPI003CEE9EAB